MNKINHFWRFITVYHACLITLLAGTLMLAGCAAPGAATSTTQVTVQVDGNQVDLQVPAGTTVQGALQQAQITLGNLDRVEPPSFAILVDKDQIEVTRVKEVFTVQENSIPFERRTINNETLPANTWLMVQKGVNGTEQITYRKILENEQEVSNKIFKIDVMVDPMPEIVMVGVQKPFTPISIPASLPTSPAGMPG